MANQPPKNGKGLAAINGLLVDRPLHRRFLFWLAMGAVTQLAVAFSVVAYFLRENYLLLVHFSDLDDSVVRILTGEMRYMATMLGISAMAYVCGIGLVGAVFAHYAANPFAIVRQAMDEIRAGRDEVTLPQKGGVHELSLAFNAMIRALRGSRQGV